MTMMLEIMLWQSALVVLVLLATETMNQVLMMVVQQAPGDGASGKPGQA